MIERVEGKGLLKRYGTTLALRGVDVTFGRGLHLIEGANGSGKTTLLGIVGGVIRPTAGRVAYVGLAEGADPRAELGWVSHDSLCYGDLTGRQNIELAARAHGLGGDVWDQARERFGLGAFSDRKVRTNSRGQRQRVALARALLHRPSVVLLDEPTTGLDAEGIRRLLGLLEEETRRGATVVVVSHEPEVFRELGAKTVVLERGRRVGT
jgi:heme exporter protein A